MATVTGALIPAIDWGVASRALPGESATGDLHVVEAIEGRVLVGVLDALGHGEEAAATARIAAGSLIRDARLPMQMLIEACHKALIGTRGVVLSLAIFDVAQSTMAWLGIGDVEGVLVLADPEAVPKHTGLATRGGIVGLSLPSARPWVIPISAGDTLVFTTDGIRSGSTSGLTLAGTPQQIADLILTRGFKGTDDALVLVARFRDERRAVK